MFRIFFWLMLPHGELVDFVNKLLNKTSANGEEQRLWTTIKLNWNYNTFNKTRINAESHIRFGLFFVLQKKQKYPQQ